MKITLYKYIKSKWLYSNLIRGIKITQLGTTNDSEEMKPSGKLDDVYKFIKRLQGKAPCVISMTPSLSTEMWSRYGENGEGICLVFEVLLEKVCRYGDCCYMGQETSEDDLYIHYLRHSNDFLIKCFYTNEKVEISSKLLDAMESSGKPNAIIDALNLFARLIARKDKCAWEQEKEYRFMLRDSKLYRMRNPQALRVLKYLKGIIIGPGCSLDQKYIRTILKESKFARKIRIVKAYNNGKDIEHPVYHDNGELLVSLENDAQKGIWKNDYMELMRKDVASGGISST